jgi:hypothetical protein
LFLSRRRPVEGHVAETSRSKSSGKNVSTSFFKLIVTLDCTCCGWLAAATLKMHQSSHLERNLFITFSFLLTDTFLGLPPPFSVWTNKRKQIHFAAATKRETSLSHTVHYQNGRGETVYYVSRESGCAFWQLNKKYSPAEWQSSSVGVNNRFICRNSQDNEKIFR